METEKRNLLIGTSLSLILSSLFSLITIWQLIFIAGIFGGIINRKVKFGALSGALGVGGFWILYVIDGVVFRGIYNIFDIMGSLLIGSDLGWLLLVIIILFGFIFGTLGGTLGSSGRNIFLDLYEKYKSPNREREESS